MTADRPDTSPEAVAELIDRLRANTYGVPCTQPCEHPRCEHIRQRREAADTLETLTAERDAARWLIGRFGIRPAGDDWWSADHIDIVVDDPTTAATLRRLLTEDDDR